jgi:hypothetical protein
MISGASAAIAGIRLGPEAALAFGTLAYQFEPMVEKALAELRPETRRRAAQMLEAAADEAGCDADQLDNMIGKSEQTRLMTGLAIVAAERAFWPPQVVALGRVLAKGLIADDDAVDVAQYALDAMSEMGRLHVSLLDLLVRHEPEWDGSSFRAVPHRAASHIPRFSSPGSEIVWTVGRRTWKADLIAVVRPELTTVLTGLAGTLIRHGLAQQADRTREAMEQFGKDFQERINRQVAGVTRGGGIAPPHSMQPPSISRIERTWTPTELGEQVLGFYLEAGATSDNSDPRS